MKGTDSQDLEADFEEEATIWILEREEGFAPGRAEAFAEWCNGSPLHSAAVARVEGTLAILNDMPAVRASLETRLGRGMGKQSGRSRVASVRRFTSWPWAAGLAAALVLGAMGWWITRPQAPVSQSFAATGTEPRRVPLADGSVVDLNLNSRLRVRFSEGERRVALDAGEAHFQVAHNATRPFIVTAHGVSVRAVGTAFNVRLTGGSVEVIVAEGKVEIDRLVASTPLPNQTVPIIPLLLAGEKTQVTPNTDSAPRVEAVAPEVVHSLLSWQNRMTSFADVPLQEMVTRINRCNVLQLVLGDPQLGERKVGGVIKLNQVNAFVQLLEQDGDIIADRSSDGVIVLRRAR